MINDGVSAISPLIYQKSRYRAALKSVQTWRTTLACVTRPIKHSATITTNSDGIK